MYNYVYTDGHKMSGGSSVLVHDSCPQREVELKTDLQALPFLFL